MDVPNIIVSQTERHLSGGQTELTAGVLLPLCCAILVVFAAPAGLTGAVSAQSEPGEPQSFFGTIETVDETPAPEGTEVFAVVNGSVEDSLTIEEAGQYGGPETLDERLNVNTGAGDEVVFTIDSPDGPEAEESPFDLDDATETPFELNLTFPADAFTDGPEFTVDIDEAASTLDVTADEELQVVADIENVGDEPGEQTITATVAGDQVASEDDISLDSGANESVTLAFPADTDFDGLDVTVASSDATATAALAVSAAAATGGGAGAVDTEEDAFLEVTELEPTEATVTQGDVIDIRATITNTGDLGAQQTIELRIDEQVVDDGSVVIGSGTAETVHFELSTADLEPETYDHGVFSADDAAVGTLTIEAPDTDEPDDDAPPDDDEAPPDDDDEDAVVADEIDDTDDDTPGFGALVALLAVMAASLIARERTT